MVYILHDFCTSFFAGGPLFAFDAAAQILEMRSHSHVPRLGLKYAEHDGAQSNHTSKCVMNFAICRGFSIYSTS